ncbi:9824_t:CDS:1, partial [Acaulospora colombiana]
DKKTSTTDKKPSNSKKLKTIYASPTAQQISISTNNNSKRNKQVDKDTASKNLKPN